VEPASGPPVVVTPEELRAHGIDRVRIIPRVRRPYSNLNHGCDNRRSASSGDKP